VAANGQASSVKKEGKWHHGVAKTANLRNINNIAKAEMARAYAGVMAYGVSASKASRRSNSNETMA